MKLVFFDESKDDTNYRHYHIGAVCIDDDKLHAVEEKISIIAKNAFGTSQLGRDTELHAVEIFHRNGPFKTWPDFAKRLRLVEDLLSVLCSEAVERIDIQINCNLLHESQDPADLAFMFLCERANDLAKAQGKLGMLIGDRESDQRADRFACRLSTYRASGTNFAYGRDIASLVDSVHFTHSHLSRFLQLADTYCWLLQFTNRNRGSSNPRHIAVFDMIQKVRMSPTKYKEWPRK